MYEAQIQGFGILSIRRHDKRPILSIELPYRAVFKKSSAVSTASLIQFPQGYIG